MRLLVTPSTPRMSPNNTLYPIAIGIFKNEADETVYKAFSPTKYEPENDGKYALDAQDNFWHEVHAFIGHDMNDPLNNNTKFGKFCELHIRYIRSHPDERREYNTLYFSTYDHHHCLYKPVHRESPIFFTSEEASAYKNLQPELTHVSCEHTFV